MGRKDASATQGPTDQYRKQIGKEDQKRAKKELKVLKRKSEARRANEKSTGWGCMVLILFLVLLSLVYLVLYFYLQHQSEEVKQFILALNSWFSNRVVPVVNHTYQTYIAPNLPTFLQK